MTHRIAPYLIFTLIWILFSFPFFFQGRIPAPLDFLVNFFAPWDKYFDSPVKNPAISDVVNQIIPWKTFTAWSLKRGEIPLWNAYNLSGAPHLANWQSGVLYPTNLLFLFLPFTTAWSLHILLQPLLAGLFMILYLKSLSSTKGRSASGGLSQISSLLGALAFSYGGFMTTWLEWGTLGHALVWLPLGLYGVEQRRRSSTSLSLKTLQKLLAESRSRSGLNDLRGHSSLRDSVSKSSDPNGEKEEGKRNYWWVAIIFSWVMSLFAGHLQISLYVIATIVAYLYFRTNHQWSFLKFSLTTIYLLLATIMIASPQLLPSFHLYQHAYRSESLDEEWFKNFRVPLYGLATFIAPDFFGNPITRNHWSDHSYVEMMGYVGIVSLLFAIFAILKRPGLDVRQGQALRNKRSDPDEGQDQILNSIRRFFIWVIIISLAFSLKSQISNLFLLFRTPVLSSSSPARIIGLITFSLAVLSSIGLDEFLRNVKRDGFTILQRPLVILAISLAGLWIWTIVSGNPNTIVSQRNLIFPTMMFTLFLSGAILFWLLSKKFSGRLPLLLTASYYLLISSFELMRFHHKFTPFTDPQYFYPEIPAIFWLKDHPDRTFGLFDANLNLPFRIATVEGYDPLVIGDYVRYTSVAETGEQILPKRTSAVQLPKNGKDTMRILNELGVKYIVQPTVHGAQPWELQLWNYPGQFVKVYGDDQYEVHQNLFAKEAIEPYAYVLSTQRKLFQDGIFLSFGTVIGLLSWNVCSRHSGAKR